MAELDENDLLEQELEDEDTAKDLYLVFETDGEEFALDVANVIEIIPLPTITYVPHVADYVKGIINLRGDIVPVISVRARFLKPKIDYTDASCIVVIRHGEFTLGLIADAVHGTITIPEDQISPPPTARLNYSNLFVKSIGQTENGIKLLLDLEKVIFEV